MEDLRKLVSTILEGEFKSHTFEPVVGDMVANDNPKCKHRGSVGEVMSVQALPDDQGKTATGYHQSCCHRLRPEHQRFQSEESAFAVSSATIRLYCGWPQRNRRRRLSRHCSLEPKAHDECSLGSCGSCRSCRCERCGQNRTH